MRKKTLAILIIIFLLALFFTIKGRLISPSSENLEDYAVWRAQKEIFVSTIPDSFIFDSEILQIDRMPENIYQNHDIFKIQMIQKRLSGDNIIEITIGVEKENKSTYILPADNNLIIQDEKISIRRDYEALNFAETYVNFTSDSHIKTRTDDQMNRRFIISQPSDIPQTEGSLIPEALYGVMHAPIINAISGGTQFRINLYTWESSTGNVDEWSITVFLNGGVSSTRSMIATKTGTYGR